MNRRNTNPIDDTPQPPLLGGQHRRSQTRTQTSSTGQQQGGIVLGFIGRLRDRIQHRRLTYDRLPDPPSPPGYDPRYPRARTSLIRAEEARARAEATARADAEYDTDSEYTPGEYSVIRHPSRDTFGTAPSRAPRSRAFSNEQSTWSEVIQTPPTIHGSQVIREEMTWACCYCGSRDRFNYHSRISCGSCRHLRCQICRPQLLAVGPSTADMGLSPQDAREYGGAYREMTVADQVARSENLERR